MPAFTIESFDLSALPCLSLSDKSELPACPAVYFALSSKGRVLYIGRSVDIRERLRKHHRVPLLEALGGVRIAWLEQNNSFALSRLETTLIKYFNPPLNKIPSYLKKEDSEKLIEALNLTENGNNSNIITIDKFTKPQPNKINEMANQTRTERRSYPDFGQERWSPESREIILEQAKSINHLEETLADLKLRLQEQMQSQHQLTEALVEQAKVITELLRVQVETNSQVSKVTVEQALTISKLSNALEKACYKDKSED